VLIYKIMLPAEWDWFEEAGRFDGSEFDQASGFVHCSSREQVARTATRFFAGEGELVLVALDEDRIESPVRWESASDGGVFPHVYGPLTKSAVAGVYRAADASDVDGVLTAH
jgi:uncharacterized protein (DUF952 family)